MSDLVLSLHGNDSAQGTSCSLGFEMAQSALPGENSSTSASPSALGAACCKLKKRKGGGIHTLHLLAFIFWLLVVTILSLNLL